MQIHVLQNQYTAEVVKKQQYYIEKIHSGVIKTQCM